MNDARANAARIEERRQAKGATYAAWLSYLALALLFVIQYAFFTNFILTEISPYFPDNHDQTGYLLNVYIDYEKVSHAAGAGERLGLLIKAFLEPSPQGKLFNLLAEVIFLAIGPSRLHALLLNLLFFFGLQLAVFSAIKKGSGRYSVSFIGVGLILALAYPFYAVGDISDFRMDFAALCAYGIFAAMVARSGVFVSWRWSIAATVAAAALILLRHLTVSYIGPLYALTLAFLVAVRFFAKTDAARQTALLRIRNAVLSGIGVLALISISFIRSWQAIYSYYWTSTLSGKNQYFKPQDGADHLKYFYDYLRLAWSAYFGKTALCLSAAALALALAFFLIGYFKPGKRSTPSIDGVLDKETFVFLFLAAAVPLLILSMGMNFNPIVASIMVAPIVLFILSLLSLGLRYADIADGKASSIALPLIAALVIAFALNHHLTSYARQSPVHQRHNSSSITKMYFDIAERAEAVGLKEPMLSVDRVSTALNGRSISIMYYEGTGVLMLFPTLMGSWVSPVTLDEALDGVRKSDFVIFSDYQAGKNWPFDVSLNEHRPVVGAVLAKEFEVLGEYEFDNTPFRVYVKTAHGATARIEQARSVRGTRHSMRENLLYRRLIAPALRLFKERFKVQKTFNGSSAATRRISAPEALKYTVRFWLKANDNALPHVPLPHYSETYPPMPALLGPISLLQTQDDAIQTDVRLGDGKTVSFYTYMNLGVNDEYPWVAFEIKVDNEAKRIDVFVDNKKVRAFEGVEAPLEGHIKLGGGHMNRFWKGSIADLRITSDAPGRDVIFQMEK